MLSFKLKGFLLAYIYPVNVLHFLACGLTHQ